ncbi:MAG TPA: DUF1326 domain-containing protein, partial [Thermoanaerobaculia bacterium]|nr:DUF1326 domain-containing protein [Thermoanaerobaculia bacterium]
SNTHNGGFMNTRALFRWTAAAALLLALAATGWAGEAATPDWHLNATIIEACSCPMFCQCYFNTKPAAHDHGGAAGHFCRFNNAYRVNKGHFGSTDLAGAKFWIAGDLGADFSQGKTDWAVLHFDPAVTPAQREGIAKAVGHVYPVTWSSFAVGDDAPIEWTATADRAEARLDGGKKGEVVLTRFQGNTSEPVVIQNLRYFGAPRNDGFVMMPNEVEAYRTGAKPFEFKGTNGFMITFDIASKDVATAPSGK